MSNTMPIYRAFLLYALSNYPIIPQFYFLSAFYWQIGMTKKSNTRYKKFLSQILKKSFNSILTNEKSSK